MTTARKDVHNNVWTPAYGDMWCRETAFVRRKPLSYDIPTDPKDPKSPRIFVNGVKSHTLRHVDDITWS